MGPESSCKSVLYSGIRL